MRIVAGEFRGRRLTMLGGRAVRPTSDRAREGIFNILAHGLGQSLSGAWVADLFAGSGAMGLEAVSRGAAGCIFVENGKAALETLSANVAALALQSRTEIIRADATRLPGPRHPVGVAFLDPPYDSELAGMALDSLLRRGWLEAGALCVVETRAAVDLPEFRGFDLLDDRRYGEARVNFLRCRAV